MLNGFITKQYVVNPPVDPATLSVSRFNYNGAQKSHDLLQFNASHWLKLQRSDWRANLVKDYFEKQIFHQ